MTKTGDPTFLNERLLELDETIQLIRRFLEDNPGDESLLQDLRHHQMWRQQLVDCLRKSLAKHRHHSVSYIFKDAAPGSINLDVFVAGLQSFGNLVSSTFKEICGARMDFQVNAIFAGSFGVLLSSPFDGFLLDGDFDRGLTTVFDTLERVGEEGTDTKELLKKNLKGNRDLIRKFTNFFDGIVKAGSPVEIQWTGLHGNEPRKTFVPIERAKKLQSLFAKHSLRDPETVTMQGEIKGISLLRNVVDIQYRVNGKNKPRNFVGVPFPPEITGQIKAAFDQPATFTINVTYDYNEATGIEVPHRALIGVAFEAAQPKGTP